MGIHYFLLFLLKNIDCGYSLEPPRRGGSNDYLQSMFLNRNMKNIKFLSKNFQFLEVNFSISLNRRVFVMQLRNCLNYTIYHSCIKSDNMELVSKT